MINYGGNDMKRFIILLVAVLLAGLVACAKIKVIAADLIKVAIPVYPVSLVPTRVDMDTAKLVQTQIYETLYTQVNSVFQPVLAQSLPECDAKGIRCVIKITQGITFHDGSTFKAQDAVYSINHLIEAKTTPMTLSIKSAAVVDETSFAINLNYPDGELLAKLSHPMFAMILADSDAGGKLEKSPIGTGPYKFVSADGKNNVILTRYDNYHGTKALTKDVQFKVYANINHALTALRDKEVNLVTNVPSNAKQTITDIKGLQWISGETAATVYLGIRNQSMLNSSLETISFRKAVMSAIDRTALAGSFDATAMTNLFGRGVFGDAGQTANFIKGAAIGTYADQAIKIVAPQFPVDFDVAAIVSDLLKQAGFTKVTIENQPSDKFMQTTSTDKNFDLMIFVWKYDLMDGGDFVTSFFGSDSINRLRVQNTDLDSLLLTANRSKDSDLRKATLHAMENILIGDGVILPLTKVVVYAAADEKLSNLTLLPDTTINLAKIMITK